MRKFTSHFGYHLPRERREIFRRETWGETGNELYFDTKELLAGELKDSLAYGGPIGYLIKKGVDATGAINDYFDTVDSHSPTQFVKEWQSHRIEEEDEELVEVRESIADNAEADALRTFADGVDEAHLFTTDDVVNFLSMRAPGTRNAFENTLQGHLNALSGGDVDAKMASRAYLNKLTSYLSLYRKEGVDSYHLDADDMEFFHAFENAEGMEEIVGHFSKSEEGVTLEHLRSYIEETGGDLEAGTLIAEQFALLEEPEVAVNRSADKKLKVLMSYLLNQRVFFIKNRTEFDNIKMERDKETDFLGDIMEKNGMKGVMSNAIKGFKEAKMSEKGMMLAGVATALFLVMRTQKGKDIVGIGLGIGALGLGANAALKTYNRVKHPDDESWVKGTSKEQMHRAYEQLDSFPSEFIDMIDDADRNIAYPIINISKMSAREMAELYEQYADTRQIPNGAAGYPEAPFTAEQEDLVGISPSERFLVLEDMAVALGFLEEEGGSIDVPEEAEEQSVFYLALHWKPEEDPTI